MTRRDWITDIGIGLVGAAAAVLTFTTLRDLAEACGIEGWLAWLVPVTVDAAGVVAARVWLRRTAGEDAVRFARWLALVCITASIAGNAGQHGMAAYHLAPPWWVVVLVSAVPPAMLGAVAHLGHLLGRTDIAGLDRSQGGAGPDATGKLHLAFAQCSPVVAADADIRQTDISTEPAPEDADSVRTPGGLGPAPAELHPAVARRSPVPACHDEEGVATADTLGGPGPDRDDEKGLSTVETPGGPGVDRDVSGRHAPLTARTTETAGPDRQQTTPDLGGPAVRTDAQLLVALHALADRTGRRPSARTVRAQLGVGADRARRLLAEFDRTGPRRAAS